ncbi:MAG: aminotransferase class I/II-fold pyridoxal phosphate-dependent enzyme, partial [Myxococcota bacterium]
FSKVFAPGLRIGYASGPAELIHGFELYKQTTNLHTSSMVQAMLAAYMQLHGPAAFRAQIERSCQVYRRNRDAMIEGARKHLPADVRFDVPTEGMFLWFRLPEGFDAARMVDTDGTDLGVLLVPGSAFSTCGGLRNCMRASFSMVEPDQIEEGMRRFGEMVRREMDRHRADRHG